MTPDFINGLFEMCGGLFLFYNCWKTYKAKLVRGVSALTTAFFAAWGAWNLWYYPSLDQMWSFAGGLVIVTANALWIGMMIYYMKRERVPTLTVTIDDGQGTEIVFPRVAKVDFELPAVHWPGLRPPPKSV